MNTTLPDPHEGVNPQPAYYAVIPATVRYCKSLPPAAKLFFGEVTALCSVEGYCWASNAYFMALYGVNRSTLQRWLSALASAGFVRVELIPGTGERRIFDLTIKAITPPQKRGDPAAKMPPPRRKNAAQSITLSIKENNKEELLTRGSQNFVGPGSISAKELREKGAASPTVQSPDIARKIVQIVSLTRDASRRDEFQQYFEFVESVGCPDVWLDAVDALKQATRAAAAVPGGRVAYFYSRLFSALDGRGVVVPAALAR